MGKVSKSNLSSKLKGFRSRQGSGLSLAASSWFIPAEKKHRKKIAPSTSLEKIGGLEPETKKLISNYCSLNHPTTQVLRTSQWESIRHLSGDISALINLKRVNDLREINKFFYEVNHSLPMEGLFIGCVETKFLRRQRLFRKYPVPFNRIYYILDFILKRIFPKLAATRGLYTLITKGRNRVLSRTETLGRLYAAGFEVVKKQFIGNNLFFVVRKVKEPLFDYEPVYGLVFKMPRIGKGGKTIYVYKMRTMHAYSEYIQKYVYEKNKLAEGGKLKDDFRVSYIGKFFRRYWIDELPMLINLFKGDLKIVGVRPLSQHYLSLYSSELIELRNKVKPGLVPPFYVDMPKTLNEIMASELKYLQAYQKNPFRTDLKYFFLSFRNIFFRRARSK
jgi:lipopolysaccharide/colanic/teichoic acid biosynthesis glycosyltransferase